LIVPQVIPTDERVWVPVDDNVWFRPLCLSASRGHCTGYDDVFTRIDKCRRHYASVGLGDTYIDQFIR
jgi:hypothetical protein